MALKVNRRFISGKQEVSRASVKTAPSEAREKYPPFRGIPGVRQQTRRESRGVIVLYLHGLLCMGETWGDPWGDETGN